MVCIQLVAWRHALTFTVTAFRNCNYGRNKTPDVKRNLPGAQIRIAGMIRDSLIGNVGSTAKQI